MRTIFENPALYIMLFALITSIIAAAYMFVCHKLNKKNSMLLTTVSLLGIQSVFNSIFIIMGFIIMGDTFYLYYYYHTGVVLWSLLILIKYVAGVHYYSYLKKTEVK